ncbi:hypothetical protein [Gracilinema caldarium]|uniref:TonB-dependent receptor-like beta-barrel domain-containing protein n=1 Tax=Gracilinema caldarium (strain ATCC 51460 / DSM 7334 / H1) TaxID=744872 RepID=F8F0V4_GRAC1|nr:hypothetical protein [Gracilinema caldarium]AEJ20240.1 hypothetical protein Spica_2115 [Gracilinema caldarium DSM 7334]
MKRLLVTALCICISMNMVLAQQESDTTVTLPDVADDVRAVDNTQVHVPSPDLLTLPIPSVAPALPQEKPISIPESVLNASDSIDTLSYQTQQETFGEIGVGASLWDGITAHLFLFRPIGTPSFTMRFSHEAQDGMAFHEAGTGFSYQKTSVEGHFQGGKEESLSWSLLTAFTDQTNGLQGQSQDFFTISHRYLTCNPTFRFASGSFTAYSSLLVSSATLSLEGNQHPVSGDVRSQELGLIPTFRLEWIKDTWYLSLEGDYSFYGLINDPTMVANSDRMTQQGELALISRFTLSSSLLTGTTVGIGTNSSLAWYIPFTLWIDAVPSDYVSFVIKGGLESQHQSLREIWELNPYTDIGPALPIDTHWFANGTIKIVPWNGVSLNIKTNWLHSYGDTGRSILMNNANIDSRGLYSYEVRSLQQFNTHVEIRKYWQFTDALLGWASQWLDVDKTRAFELYGSVTYRDRENRFGVTGTAAIPFDYDGVDIPRLDVQSYIMIGKGIRLIGDLEDLFIAFKGKYGRSIWEPYLEQGFQARLRIQFSL